MSVSTRLGMGSGPGLPAGASYVPRPGQRYCATESLFCGARQPLPGPGHAHPPSGGGESSPDGAPKQPTPQGHSESPGLAASGTGDTSEPAPLSPHLPQ